MVDDLERQRAEAVAAGDVARALELMSPEEAVEAFAKLQSAAAASRAEFVQRIARASPATYRRPAGKSQRRAKAKAARKARKRNRR